MALHSVKAWLVGKELIWYAVLGALGSKEPFKGDGTLIRCSLTMTPASTTLSAGHKY